MATKTYQQLYEKYMKGTDKQAKAYDTMATNYANSVDTDAANQIADAQKAADTQLKQAYVTKVQDQRKLNNNLTAAGIRGGMSETSNIKLANQYASNVGSINSNLATQTTNINRTAAQNKLAYQQDIDAKKQQYKENRQSEARQSAREDMETQYTHGQTKRTQNIEKYTAWASKYFDVKALKKELKKAQKSGNKLKAQIINARIGYLGSPEYKQAKKAAK